MLICLYLHLNLYCHILYGKSEIKNIYIYKFLQTLTIFVSTENFILLLIIYNEFGLINNEFGLRKSNSKSFVNIFRIDFNYCLCIIIC